MNQILKDLLLKSRFTTQKIEKEFLPRRVGLGYVMKHHNKETEIISLCKRKKYKKTEVEAVSEEEVSKSKMIR